jgi:hypothetical protein
MTTTLSVILVRPGGPPRLRQKLGFPPEIKRPSWALLKEAWKDQVKTSWGPSACHLFYKTSEDSFEDVTHEKAYKWILNQLPGDATEILFDLVKEHPGEALHSVFRPAATEMLSKKHALPCAPHPRAT